VDAVIETSYKNCSAKPVDVYGSTAREIVGFACSCYVKPVTISL
jgi:hypothetical protein